MPHASLGEFLAELQDHGELARVAAPVNSALELATITDRIVKSSPNGGPAILFENVTGSTIPVVANLLGSKKRLCRCLGVSDLAEIAPTLARRIQSDQSGGWLGSFTSSGGASGPGRWSPKSIKSGICQQVVKLGRDVNLWDLPIPRGWPEEASPVITSGLASISPGPGLPMACFPSSLVLTGQQELAWYADHEQYRRALSAALKSRQNLQVAISLGGDPALHVAAATPGIDDSLSLAGLLRGTNLELVRCRSNELEVPAGAELIIEGYVDATNSTSSGLVTIARGNGRYVERQLPLIRVTALTHRANPVFPTIVVSTPPSEESWIGTATDRLLLPMVQRAIPEIHDLHQPFASANRNILFVSVRKSTDQETRRISHALWGLAPINPFKMIVIVDADQDLHQEDRVWFRVGAYACLDQDFLFADGLARDDDYSSAQPDLSRRVVIDATQKNQTERTNPWPRSLKLSEEMQTLVESRWSEYRIEPKL